MEGKVKAMCCLEMECEVWISGRDSGMDMVDERLNLPQDQWWCGRLS